ncbi:site-specific integrase [Aliarcobacter lanthieri]|uniref:site-specific integrase n=1 Tax=Aliarcobacter lanthieri TaxID=1355374 RepID=UPI000478E8DA|nr:site-specific integrase [Aliarcobacter lanthieri]
MKITYKTTKSININTNIKLIFIDNKIDLISARFLIFKAENFSQNPNINSSSTNEKNAEILGNLFKALNKLGLTWETAIENDIQIIRDSMLGWKKNELLGEKFFYTNRNNNSMNRKLQLWFEFYTYLETSLIKCDMKLTKLRKKTKYRTDMLSHIYHNKFITNFYYDWILKVKPSPKKISYHALSRIEYYNFNKSLEKDDIIYSLFANFLVETGLRITAAFNINKEIFDNIFQTLHNKNSLDDYIEVPYIAKGGEKKLFHLPIRTILSIQNEYLSREYIKRKRLLKKRFPDIKTNTFWILEDGTPLTPYLIRKTFENASKELGYLYKKITPHWLRHTFATWTIIDYSIKYNKPLNNTGAIPDPMIILLLQEKLGHARISTVLIYISTALKLMNIKCNNGPIKISFRTFKNDLHVQKIIENEAKIEFGTSFNPKIFDVFTYAEKRNILIDDDYK